YRQQPAGLRGGGRGGLLRLRNRRRQRSRGGRDGTGGRVASKSRQQLRAGPVARQQQPGLLQHPRIRRDPRARYRVGITAAPPSADRQQASGALRGEYSRTTSSQTSSRESLLFGAV